MKDIYQKLNTNETFAAFAWAFSPCANKQSMAVIGAGVNGVNTPVISYDRDFTPLSLRRDRCIFSPNSMVLPQ